MELYQTENHLHRKGNNQQSVPPEWEKKIWKHYLDEELTSRILKELNKIKIIIDLKMGK